LLDSVTTVEVSVLSEGLEAGEAEETEEAPFIRKKLLKSALKKKRCHSRGR
jgi:hypothetical protein